MMRKWRALDLLQRRRVGFCQCFKGITSFFSFPIICFAYGYWLSWLFIWYCFLVFNQIVFLLIKYLAACVFIGVSLMRPLRVSYIRIMPIVIHTFLTSCHLFAMNRSLDQGQPHWNICLVIQVQPDMTLLVPDSQHRHLLMYDIVPKELVKVCNQWLTTLHFCRI